jgi:hypothetical protein
VAVDRDYSLAIRHRDRRSLEGGNLDGSEACGDQGEGATLPPHCPSERVPEGGSLVELTVRTAQILILFRSAHPSPA